MKLRFSLLAITVFWTIVNRWFYEQLQGDPRYNIVLVGVILLAFSLVFTVLWDLLLDVLKFSPLSYSDRIEEFKQIPKVNYLLARCQEAIQRSKQPLAKKQIMIKVDDITKVIAGEMQWRPARRIGVVLARMFILASLFTLLAMNFALLNRCPFYQGLEQMGSWFDYFYITTLTICGPGEFGHACPVSLWSRILALLEVLTGILFLVVAFELIITTSLEERRETREVVYDYFSMLC